MNVWVSCRIINIKLYINDDKYLNTTIINQIIAKLTAMKNCKEYFLQFLFSSSKKVGSLGNGWKWKIACENIGDLHVQKSWLIFLFIWFLIPRYIILYIFKPPNAFLHTSYLQVSQRLRLRIGNYISICI